MRARAVGGEPLAARHCSGPRERNGKGQQTEVPPRKSLLSRSKGDTHADTGALGGECSRDSEQGWGTPGVEVTAAAPSKMVGLGLLRLFEEEGGCGGEPRRSLGKRGPDTGNGQSKGPEAGGAGHVLGTVRERHGGRGGWIGVGRRWAKPEGARGANHGGP